MSTKTKNVLLRIIQASFDATDAATVKRPYTLMALAEQSGVPYTCVQGAMHATESRVADNLLAMVGVLAPDVLEALEEAAYSLEKEAGFVAASKKKG